MDSKIDIAIIGECLIELAANGTLADTSTLINISAEIR